MKIRRTFCVLLVLGLAALLIPDLARAGGARHGGGGYKSGHGGGGYRHGHGGGGHRYGHGGHSGWVRGYGGYRPYYGGWYGYGYGWRYPYYGYAFRPYVPFYPLRPYIYAPAAYYAVPTGVYWPPVNYTYLNPAPTLVYGESQPAATVTAAPPAPREVLYPNGKYILRGDGVNMAYQWVWIPNPPAPPPAPGAEPQYPTEQRPLR